MIRKMVICAVIALVLVPASVMAAGSGQQNAGAVPCQGQCLQNGQNCGNAPCVSGSGIQGQYQYGMERNGNACRCTAADGQCTHDQKRTRTMSCLHDGSCSRCGSTQAVQQ